MILWSRYLPWDDSQVEQLEQEILKSRGGKLEGVFYTTYSAPVPSELSGYYNRLMEEMILDLGLDFWDGKLHYWIQAYNSETDSHQEHDHFQVDSNIMCLVSWVHVIKDVPGEKEVFYFTNHRGQKRYPQPQTAGYMFAFPSWAGHGVEKIITPGVNRIVAAGNIGFPPQEMTRRSEAAII